MKIDLREIPAYWINLESNTKNRDRMQALLDGLGFKNHHRVDAEVRPAPLGTPESEKHYVGVAESMFKILGNKEINTPFIIFEDDVGVSEDFRPMIEIPDETDAVYLGVSTGNRQYITRRYNEDYLKIGGVLALHAVLYLTEEYRNDVLSFAKTIVHRFKKPIDIATASLQEKATVITPNKPFFYQSDEAAGLNKWQYLTDKPLENRNVNF